MPVCRTLVGLCLLCSMVLPVTAGAGIHVEVRVLDAFSGDELAEEGLATEQRLALESEAGQRRYLALKEERFRGRDVLEISLADDPEAWARVGYLSSSTPASNTFGRLKVETVPGGWADRFCRALRSNPAGAEVQSSVELVAGGSRHVSEPGWDGSGQVDLLAVANPRADAEWQARVKSDGKLYVRQGQLGSWHAVGTVRDDFGMTRELNHSAGRLSVAHEPARYPRRFCDRYEQQGDQFQREIVNHYFGRSEVEPTDD